MFDPVKLAALGGVLLSVGCSLSAEHRAEELRCGRYTNPRSAAICRTIAEELEFELMGHGVPAPGYKTTLNTIVKVYCRLGLTKNDVEALKPLLHSNPQVNSAAEGLLGVLGAASVGPTSVLNPDHRYFVLKDGCPAR